MTEQATGSPGGTPTPEAKGGAPPSVPKNGKESPANPGGEVAGKPTVGTDGKAPDVSMAPKDGKPDPKSVEAGKPKYWRTPDGKFATVGDDGREEILSDEEIHKSHMRRKAYLKKTQELAAARREAEELRERTTAEADELVRTFSNPAALKRYLKEHGANAKEVLERTYDAILADEADPTNEARRTLQEKERAIAQREKAILDVKRKEFEVKAEATLTRTIGAALKTAGVPVTGRTYQDVASAMRTLIRDGEPWSQETITKAVELVKEESEHGESERWESIKKMAPADFVSRVGNEFMEAIRKHDMERFEASRREEQVARSAPAPKTQQRSETTDEFLERRARERRANGG